MLDFRLTFDVFSAQTVLLKRAISRPDPVINTGFWAKSHQQILDFLTFFDYYGGVFEDCGVFGTITGLWKLWPRVYYGIFDFKTEHYGEKESITGHLRGLRGSYDCNPVILEDFGVSSLLHNFQRRTISYIPIDTRSPLSPRERGRFVLCASLRSRKMKFWWHRLSPY